VKVDADTITDDQIKSVRGCGIPLGIYVLALTPHSTAWIDGTSMTTREARDYCARVYCCPHCAEKPRLQSGDYVGPTCGRSECQEASYRENAARNRRRRSRGATP
jgi:hypothetical protein